MTSTIKGVDFNAPLDPNIKALAQGIKQKESSGGKITTGDNGTSRGEYMFQKPTWDAYSKEVFGQSVPMTRENENKVAYWKLYDFVKNKGFSEEQAAAAWNAGEGKAKSGSWKTNKGVNTINGKDIAYDTPTYVKDVLKYKNQFLNPDNSAEVAAGVGNPELILAQNADKEKQAAAQRDLDTLEQLKARKAAQDAEDIANQNSRQGAIENTLGALKDFGKGVGNSFTRGAGGVITLGNEALRQIGLGSDNPALNWGTESNKYATGDMTAGTNLAEKAGGFAGDATQILAPVPGGGKLNAAIKGTELMQKLAAGGKIASTVSKAVPLVAEGTLQGLQTDVLRNEHIGVGNTLGYGIGNAFLHGTLSKLAGKDKAAVDKLTEAINSGDTQTAEKLRQSPEIQGILYKAGLTSPEAIAKKSEEEINTVRDLLTSTTQNPRLQTKLRGTPDEDIKTLLDYQVPDVNKLRGKPDWEKTYAAMDTAREKVGNNLNNIVEEIAIVPGSTLNQTPVSTVEEYANKALNEYADKYSLSDSALLAIRKEISNTLDATKLVSKLKGKNPTLTVKQLDKIRRAGNLGDATNASKQAQSFLADGIRTYLDDTVENTLTANPELASTLGDYKKLRQAYGSIKNAQRLTEQLAKLPQAGNSKLSGMFGGLLASGGSYNPFAFYAGSAVSEAIANKIRQSANLRILPNVSKLMDDGIVRKAMTQEPAVASEAQKAGQSNLQDILDSLKRAKNSPRNK